MPKVTVTYGDRVETVEAEAGSIIGEAIAATGLPLEQPCAGRGTCGKCKILVESGVAPPDEIELANITPGQLAVNSRLACRARVEGDAKVTLAPIVLYSNKIFKASNRYKREKNVPLGLAIDLGSTTVAAFLTMLVLVSIVLFLVPDKVISDYLGVASNKLVGVLLASFFGSITLMPGFIAYPLCGILLKKGVPYMVLSAFVTTLMMVGILTYPIEKEYFGIKVAIIRNVISLFIALVVAVMTGIFFGEMF